MKFEDFVERYAFSFDEYGEFLKCVEALVKSKRKTVGNVFTRYSEGEYRSYAHDYPIGALTAYVKYDSGKLGVKPIILFKRNLKFSNFKKNYERFTDDIAKAEDELFVMIENQKKLENTSLQKIKKLVTPFGMKIWEKGEGFEGMISSLHVSGNYDKKADTFHIEIHHVETNDVLRIMNAIKSIQREESK